LSLDISNNSIVAEKQVKEADCQGASFNAGDLVQYQGEECPVSYTWNDGDIKIMLLSGIKALADGIKNNGALLVLSLKKNSLGIKDAGAAIGEMLKMNSVLKELDLSDNFVRGGDSIISTDNHKYHRLRSSLHEFGQGISTGLASNRALTKLDISKNDLGAEGGMALAAGLKGNQVIAELNIGSNLLGLNPDGSADTSNVVAIANVIGDMRAMTKLTFGDKQVITMTTEMTEANFSGKLSTNEAKIVAAFLPKCT
jgi:hypothetical protein